MKPIADSLPSSASVPTSRPQSAATPPSAVSPTALRTLWLRMAEIYGHRWTAAYGDDPDQGAGGTWAKGLAGLTAQQLGAGLANCIASADPWPPTLPEFRARCIGIPALAAVRLDVQKATPFARLVWQYLDGHRYRQSSADHADRLLREAYDLAREHVMRGGELPDAPAGVLGQEKRNPLTGSESALEAEVAHIRQLHSYGGFGDGPDADTERDRRIADACRKHGAPTQEQPAA